MTNTACGKCGAPQPSGISPDGLCPACLLATALAMTESDDPDDEAADLLPEGTSFGQFVIRRFLGRGGMAVVYEAVDTQLDRAVALKVLPAAFLSDRSFRRRFETEARTIARLEHPNIVPIYATGIEAGTPWMSMRLLVGDTLSELLARRPLHPSEAIRLLRDVASGLDYAHSLGVAHRDIKPANILLDSNGTACVADFGLAQMTVAGAHLTQTGIVAGTPHYMAPEQALGKRVDHRCDIYSLGIVAYEMLTGRPPFAGDSPVAVLLQHVHDPLPHPVDAAPGAPWMDPIRTATAKDSAQRWDSAGAFVDALEAKIHSTAADEAAPQRPPDGSSSIGRGTWTALAGAGAVILAAVLWLFMPGLEPGQPLEDSVPPPTATTDDVSRNTGESAAPVAEKKDDAPSPDGAEASQASNTRPQRGSPAPSPPADLPPSPPEPDANREDASQTRVPPVPIVVQGPLVIDGLKGVSAEAAPAEPADVMTGPEILTRVEPDYPQAAVAGDLEGEVILQGVIGVDGRVREIVVERAVHPVLGEAARRAWQQWHYQPARRNGVAHATSVRQTFTFVLKDSSPQP